MYRFALAMTPDDVAAVATLLYVEMLEQGFTRVGEFHYLHHDCDGSPYADVAEMAARIAQAAEASGIALTLLPSFYAHGSFGGAQPHDGQRRFICTVDQFATLMAASRKVIAKLPGANIGIAPHSLRAVTPDELRALVPLAEGGPVHIHAAEQVKEVEDQLFELYRDPNLAEMPELLSKRGGAHYSDVATESIAAIYNNANEHIVCSTVNNGAIPDLPDDAVVQVSSYIGGAGAQPVAFGPMPTSARGYLQLMWNMQRLVEEAAVTGDYGALLEAVALNPQTPSGAEAKQVIDELLIAHKQYLPQFADKIAELEAAGVTIKDDVVRELCEQGL